MTGNFTFGVKAGIISVSIYMLITLIFVRHVLCRFVCAAGLMQMLFGWISLAPAQNGHGPDIRLHRLQRLRQSVLHERDSEKEQAGHLMRELRSLHRGVQPRTR